MHGGPSLRRRVVDVRDTSYDTNEGLRHAVKRYRPSPPLSYLSYMCCVSDVGRCYVRCVLPLPQRGPLGEAQEDPRGGTQHLSAGRPAYPSACAVVFCVSIPETACATFVEIYIFAPDVHTFHFRVAFILLELP